MYMYAYEAVEDWKCGNRETVCSRPRLEVDSFCCSGRYVVDMADMWWTFIDDMYNPEDT